MKTILQNKIGKNKCRENENKVLGRPPKKFPVGAIERIPREPNLYQISKALGCSYSTVYRWWRVWPLFTLRHDTELGHKRRILNKTDLIVWLLRTKRVNCG